MIHFFRDRSDPYEREESSQVRKDQIRTRFLDGPIKPDFTPVGQDLLVRSIWSVHQHENIKDELEKMFKGFKLILSFQG
jgi:hypothetical protein